MAAEVHKDPPGALGPTAAGLKSFANIIRAMAAPPIAATAKGSMTQR